MDRDVFHLCPHLIQSPQRRDSQADSLRAGTLSRLPPSET